MAGAGGLFGGAAATGNTSKSFTFGAAPTPAVGTAPNATKPSFSLFGNGANASIASSSLGVPQTPATNAGAGVASGGGSLFGGPANPTATSTPAVGATSAIGKNTQNPIPPATTGAGATTLPTVKEAANPITYTEMEKKLNRWKSEVKKKRDEFLEQSRKVQECDQILVRNNAKIMELQAEVNNVKIHQHSLHAQLNAVRSHQELIKDVITREAEKVQEFRQPVPDSERELTYQRAQNINFRLDEACADLKSIISNLNAQVDGNQVPEDDPMAKISQILGAHVDTLSWVEKRTETLKSRVAALENSRQVHFPQQLNQDYNMRS